MANAPEPAAVFCARGLAPSEGHADNPLSPPLAPCKPSQKSFRLAIACQNRLSERTTVVKNNRTNEEDLREALKEKARIAKEEAAEQRVLEAEDEERRGLSGD